MSLALAAYRAVWSAALALRLPSVLLRDRPRELDERFGRGPDVPPGSLWIHAASVGETVAAGSLVRALRRGGAAHLAVTTVTRTGRERAAVLRPDVGPCHAPLDAPGPVRTFLDRVRPRCLVLLEGEVWPNLLAEISARGIPWAIASARMSARAHRRLSLIRGSMAGVLSRASAVAARTPADAERFRSLGATPEAVRVVGDLKEDRAVTDWTPPPGDVPRWIAACTRPGEEEEILGVVGLLRAELPSGELILAPRHPERFEEVARLAEHSGLPVRRWRERNGEPPGAGWSVTLVDQMGVLDEAYARAQCAFVGGSLRPFGGHSPLEAAAAGRAALVGPHTENCSDAVARLERAGGLERVTSGADLAVRVHRLLSDAAAAHRHGRAAHEAARQASGVGRATVAFLEARGVPL